MGVVVHGEVGEPGTGVGVHNDLVSPLDVQDDVLTGHRVLVVVLMVLVEDGCDLLTCNEFRLFRIKTLYFLFHPG